MDEGWHSKPAPDPSIVELASKTDDEKKDGYRCIAYQVPEQAGSNICARSYEDALVLANPDRFTWPKEQDESTEAWEIAQNLPKTETALRFAIHEKDWIVPRYIREGLIWLSAPPIKISPIIDPASAKSAPVKEELEETA
jgi:putative ATP-dependent endonuclease of OLD family